MDYLNISSMNSSTPPSMTTVVYSLSMGHIYPMTIAVATFIASILGALENLMILVVIASSKELRNRCYILIAYLAVANFICCVYYSILRILIFNYSYYLTNFECFKWSIIGLFALNTQTGLTAMLGVDRFLAISCPYKYRQWNPKFYLLAMIIPPNIYAILVTSFGFIEATDDIRVAVCFPPSAFNSKSRSVWIGSNAVIIVLVLFFYTTAHIKFKKSQGIAASDSSMKMGSRILKSLMIVMIVYASTWAFTMAMMLIISFTANNTPAQKIVEIFLVWPVVINASCNFFIYFWRTVEFRRATLKLFQISKYFDVNYSIQEIRKQQLRILPKIQ